MATYVETSDIKIFIDPGVALAPRRYGLPPHPIEVEERNRVMERIVSCASSSDVIIITHYHFDHYNPREYLEDIYVDKTIYIKDPLNNINPSQIRRSHYLLHRLEEIGVDKNIVVMDGERVSYGNTEIVFSEAYPHGCDPRLGYIVMVYIDDGMDSFLFSSDVEGPIDNNVVSFIAKMRPKLLFLDGPMTYLMGMRVDEKMVFEAMSNIVKLIVEYNVDNIILDHHFLRDAEYMSWLNNLYFQLENLGLSPSEYNIMNVAEYCGLKLNMLEAFRDRLYEEYPVDGGEE
jgi:hypothetical protein